MSSIKVVDINEEAKQEAPPEIIEETKQEETQEEAIVETKEEVVNEVVEQKPKNEDVEVKKPEKTQDATQEPHKLCDKLITCPKCNKSMKLKSYRYKHEKNCQGTIEQKPVKSFSKPRAQPKTQPKIENTLETKASPPIKLTQEVSNQVFKPEPQLSPYELARQSYIQMKEEHKARKIEKINAFKSKMF